ncbi:hypothetical protein MUO14_19760 [Halobacillus shinanisalinarum]|uniref:Uncharacterized protein n=1 Tax=Halobacillus shinanisalinarum TaxID=2932258 RepID=A0ABY4GXK8_9BACI|nr:hypothetical protein [Halobacillus shinanisalinarum]UOQ92639.1 hypothetical protein MUO14_19760 [Halobacillus shinanisalinarum]
MLGLIIAVFVFNFLAFRTNNRLTKNQVVHIWMFTIAFQIIVDIYIDAKYQGYWYFSKSIEWRSIPALLILIPPVNMIFLNWYPFGQLMYKRIFYILFWVIGITFYEAITLLPEPWGYFNHGWWNLWYSVLVNPFLLLIVLYYYKWVCKIENG